jgi:hypothetical protein
MTHPATTPGYVNGVPTNVTGASYNYSYDTMYRLSGMTDSGSNTIVSNVSYDAANRLLTMNYPGANETGGLPVDGGDAAAQNGPNSAAVLNNCFTKNAQGVYQ